MNATVLLCDYAEERLGKLYIMGAGWDVAIADVPMQMSLAMVIHVPWDQTNKPHDLKIDLMNQDGQPVVVDGVNAHIYAKFESGRPAGVPPGTPFNMPLAPRIPVISLPVGGYTVDIAIDDEPVASVPFRMTARPM